ncbi:MAG: heme-binding protein [Candidatus Sumerlaeia bacterium]|nr:heme-binding protein [Candidatus Sumerlaeia bacterium]
MKMPLRVSTLLITAATMGCALAGGLVGARSAYEEPAHEVLAAPAERVQIRRYEPRIVAEVTVDAATAKRGENDAFGYLFRYISGANRERREVSMTVPVEVREESASRKIDMTTPVEVMGDRAGSYTMRFFLPAEFTMETAPEPTDPKVRLVELPGETVATLRFAGVASERDVETRKAELLKSIEGSGWRPEGEPTVYYYDPPFTPGMFRRNEVLVKVAEEPKADAAAAATE